MRRVLGFLLPRSASSRTGDTGTWPAWLAFVGWMGAVSLAGFGSALAISAGAGEGSSVSRLMGQVGLWIGFATTAVVARRRFDSGRFRGFGFTIAFPDAARSALIGVAVQLLVVPGIYLPLVAAGVDLDVSGPAESLFSDVSSFEKIAIAVGVIAVAPVTEELLFRGVLLGGMVRRIGHRSAVWVSAIVFAASHFQLVQFPALLAIGLTLAWLAQRTGGLAAPIWAHAAFNAATVAILW